MSGKHNKFVNPSGAKRNSTAACEQTDLCVRFLFHVVVDGRARDLHIGNEQCVPWISKTQLLVFD
jgi:hypothetical protein